MDILEFYEKYIKESIFNTTGKFVEIDGSAWEAASRGSRTYRRKYRDNKE